MKRLIVTITILMLIPSITNARVWSDYYVHYTSHAFSYNNPGLDSGLRYSPYAFSPKNPSGLAPVNARWSFHLQRLIVDTGYRSWYGFHPRAYYHRDAVINLVEYDVHPYHAVYYKQVRLVCGAPSGVTTEQPSWEEMKREAEQQRKVRQALQRQLRKEADERKERRAKDGRWTIFDFLKDKEIPCQMDGISIEGVHLQLGSS